MDNFFSDYPSTSGGSWFINEEAAAGTASLFSFLYSFLKYAWAILLVFTVISLVIAIVRLAISADDIPQKKAIAQHDLAASLVMLGIMGAMPLIVRIIIAFVNIARR